MPPEPEAEHAVVVAERREQPPARAAKFTPGRPAARRHAQGRERDRRSARRTAARVPPAEAESGRRTHSGSLTCGSWSAPARRSAPRARSAPSADRSSRTRREGPGRHRASTPTRRSRYVVDAALLARLSRRRAQSESATSGACIASSAATPSRAATFPGCTPSRSPSAPCRRSGRRRRLGSCSIDATCRQQRPP